MRLEYLLRMTRHKGTIASRQRISKTNYFQHRKNSSFSDISDLQNRKQKLVAWSYY